MKKLFVIFTILFAAFNTTAWADNTKEIEVEYELTLTDYNSEIRNNKDGLLVHGLYIYDNDQKCKINDQKTRTDDGYRAIASSIHLGVNSTEGKITLICPEEKKELTLVFDFNHGNKTTYNGLATSGNGIPATRIITKPIPKNNKIKITETIETIYLMQTRLAKEAGERFCNDGISSMQDKKFCCVYGITSDSQKDALQNALNKITTTHDIKYVDTCPDDTNNEVKKQTETPNTITVTGTVKDATGEPLIGASVKHNKKDGVVTDIDGKFTIKVPQGTTLEITYIGYKTETIPATTGLMNIVLEAGTQTLSDVNVTGCRTDKEHGITKQEIKSDEKCHPVECWEQRWKLEGTDTTAQCVQQNCTIKHGTGKWVLENNTWKCKSESCDNGYRKNDDSTRCIEDLDACSEDQKLQHPDALSTGIQEETNECIATECKCGFDLNNGQCVEWAENAPCDDELQLPLNATAGIKACDNNEKAYCKITKCKTGYDPSNDGQSCKPRNVLSQKDSQEKIDKLTKNAQAMRDKEQSTENKLLGAAGIGATGIGGMQIMSAMAEQSADQDAETAMRAYLATFHCNYGGGMNVAGGETDVELPGGNELVGLYSEYVNLANDLKVRKAALGLRPGIESETILDSATSGLYDDVAIGKTSGAYASLARAMADPNGADAAAWAAQKSETADKLKTGAIVAGIGAIGSLAGNLALNSGDAKKEKSSEIEAEYEKLKKPFQALEETINNLTPPPVPYTTCPDGATGTPPNCICSKDTPLYNYKFNKCEKCPEPLVYKKDKKICDCPIDGQVLNEEKKCVEQQQQPQPPQPQQEPQGVLTIDLKADALFDFEKATLRDDAKEELNKFIKEYKQINIKCKLEIKGYTDRSGSDDYNKKLSQQRADVVSQYLIAQDQELFKETSATGLGEKHCTCDPDLIPEGKENERDYIQCVGKGKTHTHKDLLFAPCRKVEITVNTEECVKPDGTKISITDLGKAINIVKKFAE